MKSKISKKQYDGLMELLVAKELEHFGELQFILHPIEVFTKELSERDYEFLAFLHSVLILNQLGLKFNSELNNLDACQQEINDLLEGVRKLQSHLDMIYDMSKNPNKATA